MTDAAPGGPPGGEPANAGDAPPHPPSPPAAPRRLTRSNRDRFLCGVCGGLGEYFHVEPLFFRLGFAALSFLGGLGVLLYVISCILIPNAGAARPTGFESWVRDSSGRTRALVGGGLVFLAVLIAADGLGVSHDGLFWGFALLAVGVVLLVQDRWHPVETPARPLSAAAPYAAASFDPAGSGMPWAGRLRAPRERSVLGIVTVAAALLAVGLATLVASVAGISLSLATALSTVLLTLGAGLVAGTWFGRSRLLIVLGILVLPLAAGAALVNEPLSGGTGDVTASPQVLADVQGEYHLAAGHLTLDLTQVDFGGVQPTVTATVAFGQLTVIVPAGVTVDMRGHAGAGEVDLFGHVNDGLNIDATNATAGAATGNLHLRLSVGFGQVDVVSAPAMPPPPGTP